MNDYYGHVVSDVEVLEHVDTTGNKAMQLKCSSNEEIDGIGVFSFRFLLPYAVLNSAIEDHFIFKIVLCS